MLQQVQDDLQQQAKLLDGDLNAALQTLESDLGELPPGEALAKFKAGCKSAIAVRFDGAAAIGRLRAAGLTIV